MGNLATLATAGIVLTKGPAFVNATPVTTIALVFCSAEILAWIWYIFRYMQFTNRLILPLITVYSTVYCGVVLMYAERARPLDSRLGQMSIAALSLASIGIVFYGLLCRDVVRVELSPDEERRETSASSDV